MRLLFLSGRYPPETKGGGEISTHLIARALVLRGHEVQVLTEGEGREDIRLDGVMVRRVPVGLTAKPLFEKWHSRRVAQRLAPEMHDLGSFDVVHAHDFRSALVLAELELKNVIATARDYAQVCGTTNNVLWDGSRCHCTIRDVWRTERVREAVALRKLARAWQYRYNVSYRKKAFRSLPAQVFISEAQRREIAEQQDLSGQQTTVIYNPVPDSYLKAPIVDGVGGTVLYVGRVETYKGVEVLLRAWREVASSLPQAHLKILGDGAQRAGYEQLVARWGLRYRVSFDGYVSWDRMQVMYDQAEVVVAPHLWTEPFGRTAAEALARGKIMVTTDSGGPAELIENGLTGLLFKMGDSKNLAETLERALTLPREVKKEMQLAAQASVADALAPDTIAAQHEEFYELAVDV